MNWIVLGGFLLIVCGAIWLIMNLRGIQSLPPKQRASVLMSGTVWVLIGIGIFLVGRTDAEGAAAAVGASLIVLGVVSRVVVGLVLRRMH